jgi:hypothetical protein
VLIGLENTWHGLNLKPKIKEWEGCCQRCHEKSDFHIMSMFDVSLICVACLEAEKEHPNYDKACAAELKELQKGNKNFKGIGYPTSEIGNDPIDW